MAFLRWNKEAVERLTPAVQHHVLHYRHANDYDNDKGSSDSGS